MELVIFCCAVYLIFEDHPIVGIILLVSLL